MKTCKYKQKDRYTYSYLWPVYVGLVGLLLFNRFTFFSKDLDIFWFKMRICLLLILKLKPRQHGVSELFPHTLSRRQYWKIQLLQFYSAYSIHKHCVMSPLRAERRMASRRSDLLSP